MWYILIFHSISPFCEGLFVWHRFCLVFANGIWLNEGGIAHRQKLPQKFVAAFVLANVSRWHGLISRNLI